MPWSLPPWKQIIHNLIRPPNSIDWIQTVPECNSVYPWSSYVVTTVSRKSLDMVLPSKWIISKKNIKYEITDTFLALPRRGPQEGVKTRVVFFLSFFGDPTTPFTFQISVKTRVVFSCPFFRDQKSSDVGWRRIMVTCAPKFTFVDQKGTDFPNLGTQNSTVTFFSWNKAFKGHKKAQKITTALLKGQLLSFFWGNKYEDVIDVMKKQNDDPLLKMCINSTTFLLTRGTKKGGPS